MAIKNKKKKKILAISHYYAINNRGGGEVMLHRILRDFVKQGYEVDAVANKTEAGISELEGVTVYQGMQYEHMIEKDYDLIVTQFENAPWVLDKAEERGIPTLYIVHNNIEATKYILNNHNPSLVIFNTDWVKNDCNYNGKSIVVHPPIYAEEHATTPGNMITLVNLLTSKGANVFYNLAQHLQRNKFLGVKGGYFKEQQVIISRPNIQIIENTQDMKNDVWSKTRILLMPSSYESYGMVGVEAMASGIPVIATPTPGLKESLSYAGIFPRDNTLGAWKAEIIRLSNPVEYKKASDLALQRSAELNPAIELDALAKEVKKLLK